MLRVFAGFIAGVLVSACVFLFLGDPAAPIPVDANTAMAPDTRSTDQAARATSAAAPVQSGASSAGVATAALAEIAAANASSMGLSSQPAGSAAPGTAAPAPTTAMVASAQAEETGPAGKRPAIADPVLPKEYASLIEGDREHPHNLSQLHDDFSAEAPDAISSDADQKLLADLLVPIARAQGYEIASVQCRQTLCEVTAGAGGQVAFGIWPRIVRDFYDLPGAQAFGYSASSQGYRNGRRYAMVVMRSPHH